MQTSQRKSAVDKKALKKFETKIDENRIYDLKMNAFEALFDHMDEQIRQREYGPRRTSPGRSRSGAKNIYRASYREDESFSINDASKILRVPPLECSLNFVQSDRTKRMSSIRLGLRSDPGNLPILTDEERQQPSYIPD